MDDEDPRCWWWRKGTCHSICALPQQRDRDLFGDGKKEPRYRPPGKKDLYRKRDGSRPGSWHLQERPGSLMPLSAPRPRLKPGVVDRLSAAGVACVGPTKAAARIETDKAFSRDLMTHHHIGGQPGLPGLPRYGRCSGIRKGL